MRMLAMLVLAVATAAAAWWWFTSEMPRRERERAAAAEAAAIQAERANSLHTFGLKIRNRRRNVLPAVPAKRVSAPAAVAVPTQGQREHAVTRVGQKRRMVGKRSEILVASVDQQDARAVFARRIPAGQRGFVRRYE